MLVKTIRNQHLDLVEKNLLIKHYELQSIERNKQVSIRQNGCDNFGKWDC